MRDFMQKWLIKNVLDSYYQWILVFVLGMWVPFLLDDWCIIFCITWNIDIKFRKYA